MYYGSIYEHKDSYKLDFPKQIHACYSEFLQEYRRGDIKKYLHIYFNPYPEFTFKEVETLLKSLRKDLKFTLRKFKPERNKTYSYYSIGSTFEKDTIYPVVTIRTNDLTLGEIKFLYFFIRIFHETDYYVDITRNVIKAKKILPKEKIINLLVFFSICSRPYGSGHPFFTTWCCKEEFTKFESLRQFLKKYVIFDTFNMVTFKKIEPKPFKELIKIYKNI